MAEAQKDGEQSMDDILASIRKIISSEPHENDTSASSSGAGADDLSDILAPSGGGGSAESRFGASPTTPQEFQPTKNSSGASRDSNAYDRGEATNSLQSKLASLDTARGLRRADSSERVIPSDEVIATAPVADRGGDLGLGNEDGDDADSAADIVTLESKISAATEAVLKKSEPVGDTVEWKPAETGSLPGTAEELQASVVSDVSDRSSGSSAAAALASALSHTAGTNTGEVVGDSAADDAIVTAVRFDDEVPETKPDVATSVVSLGSSAAVDKSDDGSLEAVVVKALEPMLREWIDANLPRLVEERLQAELERQSGALKSAASE